jgi:hypothetical protein
LNIEAARLTSTHPTKSQDIESKRYELEEAWANLKDQVTHNNVMPSLTELQIIQHFQVEYFPLVEICLEARRVYFPLYQKYVSGLGMVSFCSFIFLTL